MTTTADSDMQAKIEIMETEINGVKRVLMWQLSSENEKATIVNSAQEQFVRTCLCVCLASILDDTILSTISFYVCPQPSEGGCPRIEEFVISSAYAVGASLVFPMIGWFVRKKNCEGETTLKNWMKLQNTYLKMLVAWAWKSWASSTDNHLRKDYDLRPVTSGFIIAAALTFVIAASGLCPCYLHALAAKDAAAESDVPISGDNPFRRVLLLPGSLGLANGFAWNLVFVAPVTIFFDIDAVADQDAGPKAIFKVLVMAIYFAFTCVVAVSLTIVFKKHSEKLVAERSESEKGNQEGFDADDVKIAMMNLEMNTEKAMIETMSLIYGWSVLNFANTIWFNWLFHCDGDALKCTYQSNFLLCVVLSVLFSKLTVFYQAEKRKSLVGQTYAKLQVTAMSLVVGWTWKNFFLKLVHVAGSTTSNGWQVVFLWACFAIMNAVACVIWDMFLWELRVKKRNFKEEREKLRDWLGKDLVSSPKKEIDL